MAGTRAVQLDGSSSSDPLDKTLIYSWTIVSQPACVVFNCAPATLINADTVQPTLSGLRQPGDYIVALTVNNSPDGSGDSDTAQVTITLPPFAIAGVITAASGALASLAPVDTPFSGDFDFSDNVYSAQVILSGFCFTTDAVRLPPASLTCPGDKTAVPVFARGDTVYTGAVNPPGTIFDQAGSTFDGADGILQLLAFSPSFSVNIAITITFNSDGTGTLSADAGFLGTAAGELMW